MSSITIGGIVSGLDTTSIIDKLVAVEGNSRTLLAKQQTTQKSAVSAYASLLGAVGTLSSQVGKLADTSTWATTSASSSSASVTATATGKTASSLTFDVTALAAAHTLISAGTVNSTGATVASGGTLTLTRTGTGATTSIDVGNGTLAEVVAAINGAGAGLNAQAVQTSPGQYRLQVNATSTGTASQFTLTGLSGALNTLTTGANAAISVGSGPNAYTVTSSTNTFSGVASGLSFTVGKLENGVTVSSSVDASTVADQISSIVTNANNLLSGIASSTAWDSSTKTGGALLGSDTARALSQGILGVVAGSSAPGLSVTSTGQLAFDQDAFTAAFNADPDAVARAFGRSSTFEPAAAAPTATATVAYATSRTAAGSYAVNVDANAKPEQWQVIQPGTGIVGRLITLTRGATSVSHTVAVGQDATAAAASLNAKLAEAGFGVSATESGGKIMLTSTSPGAAGAFTAEIDGGGTATQLVEGQDAVGTIDGETAIGKGNVLSLPVDAESGAAGMSVLVGANDSEVLASAGGIGTVTYRPGVAQQLQSLLERMSNSQTGSLVQAQDQASAQVGSLQTQIDNWTTRLDDYRKMLTTKFTAMESALSSLKAQSTALGQFFNTSSSSSSSS